jgi:protein lifeguard
MVVTLGVAVAASANDIVGAVVNNPATILMACVVTLVSVCYLACSESARRQVPLNFGLMGALTLGESVMVGSVSSHYETESVHQAIAGLACITSALWVGAMNTKLNEGLIRNMVLAIFAGLAF